MLLALSALAVALAVSLAAPGVVASVQYWARLLGAANDSTRERELPESFLFVDPRHYAVATLVLVLLVATVAYALSGSGIPASLAGAGALLLPTAVARWLRRRRRRQLLYQLPDAIDLLAASLRSGLGLTAAFAHLAQHQTGPLHQELGLLVRKQRLGATLEAALEDLHRRLGGAEVGLLITAVSVAGRLGGNLSDVLQRLSHTLREKQAIEGKIAALTAQGRMQARIVGALPLLLLVVMTRMEPQAMHLLYTTRAGWATLLVLAVLEVSGALLLRRLVRIDV